MTESRDRETPNGDARRRPSWRTRLLLVALGVGLSLLALVALEATLAALGLGEDHLYDDPYVGFAPGSDLFARQRTDDGAEVYRTRPEKLAFFNEQTFAADKPDDGYRVFALGGSTTAGRPYDDRVAFPRWLELYLSAADPSRTWEVVNAGAISYASYRVVVLMQELVRYQPDLFLVYTGHNEFLEERSYSRILEQPEAWRRARTWLSHFRFASLLRRGVGALDGEEEGEAPEDASTLAPEVVARLDSWSGLERYERDDELEAGVIEHFEFNLRQMVRIARDHGARLVLVQPASNVLDFSPFKSQHRAGLAAGERERFADLLSAGRERLEQGDPVGAAELLREAREIDPRHAEARFRLGRALFAADRVEEAHAELIAAKEEDVAPLRALEPLVSAVERVAGEEGVPLVPLRDLLREDSRRRFGHPILGEVYLLDHVHPDVPVHSRIAEEVMGLLVDDGTVRPADGWSAEARRAIYRREVAAFDDEYRARRDLNLAKVLGWAGKLEEAETPLRRAARELPDEPEVWLNLGIVYQRTGRPERSLEALLRARELAPGWELVHFNLGVTYGRLDRLDEGVASLRRALEIRPDYPEAQRNLGVLLRRSGDLDASLAALDAAERSGVEDELVSLDRALVYRRQGRLEEALGLLRRLVEASPDDPEARTELGITLARAGDLDAAASQLRRAVELDPAHAEALYNLGVVHAQQGDREAAERLYRRTLDIVPHHPQAHNNLGILSAARGDLEAARRHFETAVQGDPGYAEAYLNLGVALDGLGRGPEALAAVERAVELEPANPRFQLALGRLYAARGRAADALRHLERARSGGEAVPEGLLTELRRAAGR